MKKRAIGTIALLTITLSVLSRGEGKSNYRVPEKAYKAIVKPVIQEIDTDHALLSNTNKANLSQADGGE